MLAAISAKSAPGRNESLDLSFKKIRHFSELVSGKPVDQALVVDAVNDYAWSMAIRPTLPITRDQSPVILDRRFRACPADDAKAFHGKNL